MQHYILYRALLFALAWLLGSSVSAQAVRGRVLGPDGEADSSARVELRRAPFTDSLPSLDVPSAFATLIAQSRARQQLEARALATSRVGKSGRFALDATGVEPGRDYCVHIVSGRWLDRISPTFRFTGPEFDLGELRLERGAVLTGRVVAGVSGAPIEGAIVRLRGRVRQAGSQQLVDPDPPARPLGWTTTSAADGSFRLDNVPAEQRMLQVVAANFAATTRAVAPSRPAPKNEASKDPSADLEIALANGKTCAVRVVNSKGQPIAGGRVEQVGSAPILVHTTDAGGKATILGLASGQRVQLRIRAEGYITDDHSIPDSQATQTATLRLRRDVGVLVRILGEDEQIAPTAQIRVLFSGRPLDSAEIRRQASGEYLIRNLPPDLRFDVEGRPVGGRSVSRAIPEPGSGDQPAKVTLTFQPGLRRTGRVIDAEGKPVANAMLRFHWRRQLPPGQRSANFLPFDTRTVTTDREGAFAVDSLDPGDYVVEFERGGFAKSYWKLAIDDSGETLLEVSRGHSIKGRVLDHAGQPAGKVPVQFFLQGDWPRSLSTMTDDEGYFESPARIPPGPVTVRARPNLEGIQPLQMIQVLQKCSAAIVLGKGAAPEPVTIRLPKR